MIVKDYMSYDSWIFTLLIAIVVYYLVDYLRKIKSYPRGPFPLPIVGNSLLFRGSYNDPSPVFTFVEWAKKYGQIFTIWVGTTPVVVVNSYELNNEASIVKRNDYIDRADSIMNRIFKNGNTNIFASSGPDWEALRKVGLSAARKLAVSDRLPLMISEIMDQTTEMMLKENNPLNPIIFIDFMVYNILAYTAYGTKYESIDDKEFRNAKRLNDEFYEVAPNGLISEFIPWLRPFYYLRELRLREIMKLSVEITKEHFMEHKKKFYSRFTLKLLIQQHLLIRQFLSEGVIRDFTDCVLEAKEEALKEDSSRAKYLIDDNLLMVVSDLFQAGTDTTQTTLRWSLLILSNDQKLQTKIHNEIVENIGQRIPTQDDKNILPFTYGFLLEVLRFRPPAPIGLDHVNSNDTQLNGYKIPKKTRVIFNLYAQNNDPKYWNNPEKFDPNRFVGVNGKLKTGRMPSYVTFGLGRRACPGEKLALNNAFLVISRLMQNMRIELSTGYNSADLIPVNVLIGLFPKDYKILCYARN